MKFDENKIIKDFKAVKFMRQVRDKISNDIKDMNFEQIQEYFKNQKLNAAKKV